MSRLLVQGRLVDPEWGVRHGQVLIENGRITRVGDGLGRPDLAFGDDCLVFPGFGDIHVHLREGQEYKEDYASGSAAALAGGVTFCLDMPNNPVPPVDAETMAAKQAKVGDPPIEIGLYAATGPGTRPFGHDHYKCFMAHSIGPLYFEKLSEIGPALEPYRGCQVTFHCEDPELLTEGKSHEENRPPEAEAAAVKVAIELAQKLHLKANIAHLSTASGLELLLAHPHITREVTPTHLFFDTENRHQFERSELLKMNPPLRGPDHRRALLEAFKQGQIHFLATDHAPHTLEEKTTTNPSGVPHLDTYGLFVSWLLVEQGLAPAHLARHACLLPGQFVGKKLGRLAEGYSGDVAVLNLGRPTTVRADQLHTKAGWSPFEGVTFPGQVECTVARGVVFRSGVAVG